MKKLLAASAAAVIVASHAPCAHALFVNGGFETGDFTGWTLEYGYFYGGTLDNVAWGSGTPHAKWEVIGSGVKQPGQELAVSPYSGSFMARINDVDGWNHATRLSQTDIVTPQDVASGTVISVQWGAMLVDPMHAPGQQPIFGIKVRRNGIEIASFSADATDASAPESGWVIAGADQGGEPLWYLGGKFEVPTSDLAVGDNVTIEIAVADCALSGHGAFAFLDGIGTVVASCPPCDPAIDLDDDGEVGPADLGLLLASWGECPPSADDPAGCVPAPEGLIGWWRAEFDAIDSIGNHDGALLGGATFGPGWVGQWSFFVDGINDYVEIADAPELNVESCQEITVLGWVFVLSSAPVQHVFGKRVGCGGHPPCFWQLALGGGGVEMSDVNDGQWHLVAITIDPTTGFQHWVDGKPNGTPGACELGVPYSNTAPFTIGTSGSCGGLFGGLVDEVQIYNRALRQDELVAIFEAGSSGVCTAQPCIGDIDRDGDVDAADLGMLLAAWCN